MADVEVDRSLQGEGQLAFIAVGNRRCFARSAAVPRSRFAYGHLLVARRFCNAHTGIHAVQPVAVDAVGNLETHPNAAWLTR